MLEELTHRSKPPITSFSSSFMRLVMTLVEVDKRNVEKDWNAEKANQNQDDFQSYCQKFPQSEKDQTFVTEVISKIKRLKMKGKRAEEKVSSGLKKSPYWQQKN